MAIRQWVSSPTHTWKELLDRLESVIAQNKIATQAMDEGNEQRCNSDPQQHLTESPSLAARRGTR